jgi:alkylated DNA repair dioxygenase AlkB
MTELPAQAGKLDLPNATIRYIPGFISSEEADRLYVQLKEESQWRSDRIQVFGKWYDQPRLTALYGEEGRGYSYSGIAMTPLPFTPLLKSIKSKVEEVSGSRFTSCLLNFYRDGKDSNGWHSDDEAELGINPVIASISLGVSRYFHLRPKGTPKMTYKLLLSPGSLLIMAGETQHQWQHQIPKSKQITEGRINLTFRRIRS